MEKTEKPFETEQHDLWGYGAIDFAAGSFQAFASLFPGYNPERFEPVNLKILLEAGMFTITLYAHDKTTTGEEHTAEGGLPVKKFKVMMAVSEFEQHVTHFAVSLSSDGFNIAQMRVTNK